ncbi:hypothetical protein J3459_010286 [Metarhizium acridum]|nr:hypothetical protein J3459_010286 [Metarhizium acridum]
MKTWTEVLLLLFISVYLFLKMAKRLTPQPTGSEKEQRIPQAPVPAFSTPYAPEVRSSETDSSRPTGMRHDDVHQILAHPAGASSTSPTNNATLKGTAASAGLSMTEQPGRQEAACESNPDTLQSAHNTGVSQTDSHDDQTHKNEYNTCETECCIRTVVLDGTSEGIDLNCSLPWLGVGAKQEGARKGHK